MPAVALTGHKTRETGLKVAVLFEDGYGHWGWICWRCSRSDVRIQQDGFATRGGARKAARDHEKRRGH